MIPLDAPRTRAWILPDEGGVAASLRIDGRDALASGPAADEPEQVRPPALTEHAWVRGWRGGWQLCFPSAGQPEPGGVFHGAASQAPWTVLERGDSHVVLRWDDASRLSATRTWTAVEGGLEVTTTARNDGRDARRVVVAEHLILGRDVLSAPLRVTAPAGTLRGALDYDGAPSGDPAPWNGATVDHESPAAVAALTPGEPWIGLEGEHVRAHVSWTGLAHALLWEELGASAEPPWDGRVFAVGVEPTSTPHGMGTGFDDRVLELAPGTEITWTCALRVDFTEEDR